MDAKFKIAEIVNWLEMYKEATNCKGVCVGLSGGKDSTVVTMLCKKVWGDNVMALLMPNGYQEDIEDSYAIAKQIGIEYRVVNVETAINNLVNCIENVIRHNEKGELDYFPNCSKVSEKARTNIPPRVRMTALYAIAQTMGYRVVGTGNKSEGFLGWCTKHGDIACDFNPIAHLTCTEVIEVGKELAKEYHLDEKYIVKTPADGLTGKSDEENLGFSYTLLDKFIDKWDEVEDIEWKGLPISSVVDTVGEAQTLEKIKELHKGSSHKRRMPYTIVDNLLTIKED